MEDLAQPELSDNLIEQFGRQILVPGIDEQGQLNLSKRKVCIIGLGALGTVASQYLVRSGIGEVHLIDPDQIEESNLHRQINYTLEDVGAFKSEVSKNKLQGINDITKIISHQTTYENYLKEHTNENFDLIFDCTDNHENKILSSQLCKKNKIAYVSISINSTEGIYFSQNYEKIMSPMVGTFYRKPSPDKDNFVEIGDQISEGQTLCVIEAMKLFNEIESDISGKIVKVLVDDSTPVEFDQPLFLVEP